jgi:hypothetical protein
MPIPAEIGPLRSRTREDVVVSATPGLIEYEENETPFASVTPFLL